MHPPLSLVNLSERKTRGFSKVKYLKEGKDEKKCVKKVVIIN